MEKRRRYALIGGIAAVLLAIAVVVTWQVAQHRAEQAFIAEQYAKLEEDKAALEPDSDLGEKWAIRECADLHGGFEYDDAKVVQNVSTGEVFLYLGSGEEIEVAHCDAEWVDTEWVVSA